MGCGQCGRFRLGLFAADHGEDLDRLGGGQFGDGQYRAGRRAQAQQLTERTARAGLDDERGRDRTGRLIGDQRRNTLANRTGKVGLDHRLAGRRIMQPLNDRLFEAGVEGDRRGGSAGVQLAAGERSCRAAFVAWRAGGGR